MVERLVAEGLNDCDVSRRTGIPRTTIRDWRQAGFEREELGRLDPGQSHQHDFTGLPPTYAYLLGLHLGDGSISRHARGVYRLRITLDSAYPVIIAACRASMAHVNAFESRVGPGAPRRRLRRRRLLFEALAVLLSAARARAQAQATDRARRLAAPDL
jgi:hypothetical protein